MTFKDKISQMRSAGVEVDLGTLIALAVTHEVTDEEKEAQRKAWVVSELVKANPKLRRDRAESLYLEARKKYGL